MLRLIKPTVAKVAKDVETLRANYKANQPDPNCGVRYMPFDYFMQPQKIDGTGSGSGGVGLFPKTLSEAAFADAVKECSKYQQELLDKFDFNK
jgi:hypothetical protein